MNIVTSFLAAAEEQAPKNAAPISYAIQLIKLSTGRTFTHSRVRDWESGGLGFSSDVYNFMMGYVLTHDRDIQSAKRTGCLDDGVLKVIEMKIRQPLKKIKPVN